MAGKEYDAGDWLGGVGVPKEEFERLKEALKKPPTEEARKEAAQRFREYEETKDKKRSRPTLVSLGLRKPYPTSIEIKDIPAELERNPAFYEHLKEIVED